MAELFKKTVEDNFTDWENHVFGFGYGSGEEHTLMALKRFLELCPKEGCYDYHLLERELTPLVAWLLINILCHADIIEYGSSPRTGWLDHKKGQALKTFVEGLSVDSLYALTSRGPDYTPCYPDVCNCGYDGDGGQFKCTNPFW